MQIHFNLWPGDASFGGNFDPAILPVQQYVSWVQYSSLEGDEFALQWREDFSAGALPSGWAVGNWSSPKNYSIHSPTNVSFKSDAVALSLTADDALGFAGEPPSDDAADVSGDGAAGSSSSGMSTPAEVTASGGSTAATTPTNSAAGAPPPSGYAAEHRGDGCSVATSQRTHSDWLLLAVGIALASRRSPRAVRHATRDWRKK
jgi:hypothetical protein